MPRTPTRVGRPTQAEARQIDTRIRKAAIKMFVARGFDETSMEAVAREAGVTKRTLYAHHPGKRALFSAVVSWALMRQDWDEPPLEVGRDDLAAGLMAIARSTLAHALNPDLVRLRRMAENQSEHLPELGLTTYTLTWSPRIRAVRDLLAHHVDAGTIVVGDLAIAAEQFIAIVALMPARLAAFGEFREPEDEQRHLEHAVELFLHGVLATHHRQPPRSNGTRRRENGVLPPLEQH